MRKLLLTNFIAKRGQRRDLPLHFLRQSQPAQPVRNFRRARLGPQRWVLRPHPRAKLVLLPRLQPVLHRLIQAPNRRRHLRHFSSAHPASRGSCRHFSPLPLVSASPLRFNSPFASKQKSYRLAAAFNCPRFFSSAASKSRNDLENESTPSFCNCSVMSFNLIPNFSSTAKSLRAWSTPSKIVDPRTTP